MTTSGADSPSGTVAFDWDELAGLDRIAVAYTVGEHAVVLETTDGREIRITALYDRARGKYVAEFERRSVVKSGNKEVRVWAQTPAYKRRAAEDAMPMTAAAIAARRVSREGQEGLKAFLEKRAPAWSQRFSDTKDAKDTEEKKR